MTPDRRGMLNVDAGVLIIFLDIKMSKYSLNFVDEAILSHLLLESLHLVSQNVIEFPLMCCK